MAIIITAKEKILKYLKIKELSFLPKILVIKATAKKRDPLPIIEAKIIFHNDILNMPAEIVIILNGIGVKAAINTVKKAWPENFSPITLTRFWRL